MTTAILLVLLGAFSRLVPHPANFAPLGAIAALLVLLAGAGASALPAQTLPPVAENVVVTATMNPEEEKRVGSATTVITREEIEKSGRRTVLELLRSVPGVDVNQSGGEGSLASVFLRGTNSTQTLVLVDGVRMNSPFFAGYDFSNLTTENVERIEIVRGPFSALYGSDAIGGVIQIFTRPAKTGFSGQVKGEAGNDSTQTASAFVTGGSGPLRLAASYLYGHTHGDRENSDYRRNNGSARIEWQPSSAVQLALEGAILDGEGGNPGPVGAETPLARGTFREERIELPAAIELSPTNRLGVLVGQAWSKPTFDDPGSYAFETDARILQTRISDTAVLGAHTVTAVASWERWIVTNVDNFGTNLDDDQTTIWGLAAQDTVTLGRFIVTAGLRYDQHSEFGGEVSPRGTLVWLSKDSGWKVRASGGSAFRAPTVGELYYPFGANPNLQPERSVSWEVGAESYVVAGGRGEISLFWNDLDDLIVFDFATGTNENVGRARTRGIEVGWQQQITPNLAVDATYTYLDAQNLVTGAPLNRRPHNKGALGIQVRPLPPLEVAARGLFVGSRPDVDPLTFGPTEDPAYFRLDFFVEWDFGAIALYARLNNALNHQYDEASGFPAPGRLGTGGLAVRF